jgi:para-nitrobenzyl esterase
MQATWATFARTGKPDNAEIPHWPVYTLDQRATLIFDRECRVENDAGGETRRLWKEITGA